MKTVRIFFLFLAVIASLWVPARLEWEEQERARHWVSFLCDADDSLVPDSLINSDCGFTLRIDGLDLSDRPGRVGQVIGFICCTVWNNSGQTKITPHFSAIEWSPDRTHWYGIYLQSYKLLRLNKIHLLDLAAQIEFTRSENRGKQLPYLPEGTTHMNVPISIDTERERDDRFPDLPDGYYRLVLRICEYADPSDLFHMTARLEDYAWIRSAPVRVRNGQLA